MNQNSMSYFEAEIQKAVDQMGDSVASMFVDKLKLILFSPEEKIIPEVEAYKDFLIHYVLAKIQLHRARKSYLNNYEWNITNPSWRSKRFHEINKMVSDMQPKKAMLRVALMELGIDYKKYHKYIEVKPPFSILTL